MGGSEGGRNLIVRHLKGRLMRVKSVSQPKKFLSRRICHADVRQI